MHDAKAQVDELVNAKVQQVWFGQNVPSICAIVHAETRIQKSAAAAKNPDQYGATHRFITERLEVLSSSETQSLFGLLDDVFQQNSDRNIQYK